MIKLPKFDNQSMYDYETYFNLTMNDERLGKFLAHYEAMKIAENIPGEIVECGVFKGTSFARFAIMRRVMGGEKSAKIFGFDAKLKLNPSVNWIGFQFLISNYFYSDPLSFPLQPDKVFKNIITLNTKWINIDLINRNEGKKVLSSILSDGTIVENSLKPNIGFDYTIFKKFNYKFLKFSISLSWKNLLSKETSISGISIYDKRYYFSINVKI